jgi:hypothetical protein
MPEEDLKKKIAAFESSVARFESERQTCPISYRSTEGGC